MTITKVTIEELNIVKTLAYKIWPIAYSEILSSDQLTYMLDKFYCLSALESQMLDRSHVFLLAKNNNDCVGFASYELNCENNEKAKLHKIYVLPETKGVGLLLLDEVEKRAKAANCTLVFLNVNRFNKAQEFYKKHNYIIVKEENIAIGNGYLMEDYVMEKEL
jgi:diamine N-acetyltransferase